MSTLSPRFHTLMPYLVMTATGLTDDENFSFPGVLLLKEPQAQYAKEAEMDVSAMIKFMAYLSGYPAEKIGATPQIFVHAMLLLRMHLLYHPFVSVGYRVNPLPFLDGSQRGKRALSAEDLVLSSAEQETFAHLMEDEDTVFLHFSSVRKNFALRLFDAQNLLRQIHDMYVTSGFFESVAVEFYYNGIRIRWKIDSPPEAFNRDCRRALAGYIDTVDPYPPETLPRVERLQDAVVAEQIRQQQRHAD